MIDPRLYKYHLIIMDSKKKTYDISQLASSISWEEAEGELACRISFTVKNDKYSKSRISSLAKPGCWCAIMYSYNGKKAVEACRGKIVEWNPSAIATEQKFTVKAYDTLFDLQQSQDHILFSSGKKTKSIISSILKDWGLSIGTYSGPNVTHSKLVYKSEKLGTVIVKVLKDAKQKGGKEAVLRANGTSKINVVGYGSNSTIYCFEETEHMTRVDHKISTANMVTRVKIIGQENKSGSAPVYATVNGSTSYGIRQKIQTKGKDDTLDAAKKTAKETIRDEGKPKETIAIQMPDMPVIHKGDVISLKTSSITKGYYYVVAIMHDATTMTMTMDVESADNFKKEDDKETTSSKKTTTKTTTKTTKKTTTTKSKTYHVGDIVTFKGGKHYVSSYKGSKGYSVKGGKAKITKINPGSAHPYHLVTQNYAKSHVYGWVDSGTFS